MSQNINIIYKVDSTQVAASTNQVNQAKAATDNLTAAAKKFSDQSQRSNAQFSNTIEGTRLKMQQLKAQIDLTNQSDTARLNSLTSQYKAQQAQLEKYTSKLKETSQAQAQASQSTGNLVDSTTQLYNALKLVIGAAIVKQFVSMSLEAATLSGKVDGVRQAFIRAFPASVSILNDLRTATHGTVTDFELMQRTLQATNLGVAIEQLPVLFEFAAARAQQTGESVDYLVDSIVRGIGRKSILVLDNLGLSATRLKEQFHGASLQSQSVADVTVGVAAIAKQELEKMGGYIETNKTKVDQLTVSWENLKISLAELASQKGGIIDFFKGYIDALGNVVEAQKQGITVRELFRQKSIQESAQAGIDIIKQDLFTQSLENNIKVTQDAIAAKTHDLILGQQVVQNLSEQLKAAKNYQEVVAITQARKDQDNANKVLIEQIKLLKGLEGQMTKNISVTKEDVDSLDALEKKLKDLNEQLKDVTPISTAQGVAAARSIKNQINATQDKIDIIKTQIYWEEELQRRMATGNFRTVVDLQFKDPKTGQVSDKNQSEFLQKFLNDLGVDLSKGPSPIIPVTLAPPPPKYIDTFLDKLGQAFDDPQVKKAINRSFNIAESQVASIEQMEVKSYDVRINALNDFYNQQIALAGDNDKAKQQLQKDHDKKLADLERQRAQAAKKAALNTILINTAIGITKAFATSATIYDGIIEAAFVAAEGASQYAIASRQQYKDGVIDVKGPGTSRSDSIPAMISVGESVMTAKETKESGRTLRAIRAKKLNDKVLDKIMSSGSRGPVVGGFDDTRLVAETRKVAKAAAGNDLVRKGSIIYEAHKEGENLTRYIRSKTLN